MSPAFASEGARAAAVSVSTTEKQAKVHRVHHPPPTHLLKVASRVLRPSIPAPAPFHPHPLAASPFRSPTHLQELVLVGVLFEQLGQDLQERGSVWVGGGGAGGGMQPRLVDAHAGRQSLRGALHERPLHHPPPTSRSSGLVMLWIRPSAPAFTAICFTALCRACGLRAVGRVKSGERGGGQVLGVNRGEQGCAHCARTAVRGEGTHPVAAGTLACRASRSSGGCSGWLSACFGAAHADGLPSSP